MSLLNCNDVRVAYAFLDMVFNKFHVSIELIIDQGKEFCEEFQKLFKGKKIDHCTTSKNHLEVNKLAK
jgi:hypothetical protein